MRWDEMRWWRHDVLMSRGRHAALLSRGHVTTVSCHDDVMPWIWCHVMNTMPRWCHIMNKSCHDDVMSRWCHANMMSCHEYDVTMMSLWISHVAMVTCHEYDVMSWAWCLDDVILWTCLVAMMPCREDSDVMNMMSRWWHVARMVMSCRNYEVLSLNVMLKNPDDVMSQ